MFNGRFFPIFKRFCEISIFGEKTGHQAISEFNFESFLKFPHFLKSSLLLLLLFYYYYYYYYCYVEIFLLGELQLVAKGQEDAFTLHV